MQLQDSTPAADDYARGADGTSMARWRGLSPRLRRRDPVQYLNDVQSGARRRILRRFDRGVYRLAEVRCPLCGGNAAETASERETYGLPVEVAVCQGCGLVYTRRRMDDATLRRFYNEDYRRLERGTPLPSDAFFELQRTKGPLIRDFLAEAGMDLAPDSLIVEIGCGAGGVLAYFGELGYAVAGCDIGREYVRYACETRGLDVTEGGLDDFARQLRQQHRTPALVIYEQVLEHVPDPVAELARVRHVFAGARAAFVGVPGLRNIDAHYNSDFARYLQAVHLTHLDLASTAAIADRAGWQVKHGNEVVRALLAPRAPGAQAAGLKPLPARETLDYLAALEERYVAKLASGQAVEVTQRENRWQTRLLAAVLRGLRRVPGLRPFWHLLRRVMR